MNDDLNRAQYQQKQATGRCMALVSILLIISAVYLLITNTSMKADTTPVQAEITAIEYLYAYGDTDGTEIEGVTSLTAVYEVDGAQMEARIEGGNPLWVVGDTIEIALDNDDPTAAQYPPDNTFALILLGGSVLSGTVAAYNLAGVKKIRKMQQTLEEEEQRKKQEEQTKQD